MQNGNLTILQISDLHLFANEKTKFLGLNTYDTAVAVIEHIKTNLAIYQPQLLLVTGDISQDYSKKSYQLAKQMLQNICCDIVAIPGNHDNQQNFEKVFLNSKIKIDRKFIKYTNWQIILLNSLWPKHVEGRLNKQELEFLKNALIKANNTPTLIFLHHPVFPVGSPWLDKFNLQNTTEFLNIIKNHHNIKAIVSGHVHQEWQTKWNHIDFFTTPATSWQFVKNTPKFKLDAKMPGFRLLNLHKNGNLKTEIIKINYNADFVPDLTSTGYN